INLCTSPITFPFSGNGYGIFSAITGQAKDDIGLGDGINHPFKGEVGQAVLTDKLAGFLHGAEKLYVGFDVAGAGKGLSEYRASPRPY
ncbi:MAG: hypothetical protein QME44_03580, partial [Thermodesulfobacteriota bacterium]|nr:hypothetical protein [Thermodesulfobacteriota bacterium]